MSRVVVVSRSQGVFRVEVVFSCEECDRLPLNALRKVRAALEPTEAGGLRAVADFNLRHGPDADTFVEWLLRFGDVEAPAAYASPPAAGPGVPAAPPPFPAAYQRPVPGLPAAPPSALSRPAAPPPADSDLIPESPPLRAAGPAGRFPDGYGL